MIQDQNGTFSAAFVCTGNICRSPMAEALARYIITKNNIGGLHFTSAGTHGYHVGERPDPRTLALLKQRGIETQGLRAKKFTVRDFEAHDVILGLDQGHVESLLPWLPRVLSQNSSANAFAQKGRGTLLIAMMFLILIMGLPKNSRKFTKCSNGRALRFCNGARTKPSNGHQSRLDD